MHASQLHGAMNKQDPNQSSYMDDESHCNSSSTSQNPNLNELKEAVDTLNRLIPTFNDIATKYEKIAEQNEKSHKIN